MTSLYSNSISCKKNSVIFSPVNQFHFKTQNIQPKPKCYHPYVWHLEFHLKIQSSIFSIPNQISIIGNQIMVTSMVTSIGTKSWSNIFSYKFIAKISIFFPNNPFMCLQSLLKMDFESSALVLFSIFPADWKISTVLKIKQKKTFDFEKSTI